MAPRRICTDQRKVATYVTFAFVSTILGGCAAAPKIANMIPSLESKSVVGRNKTVAVEMTSGGRDPSIALTTAHIDNAPFHAALVQTLKDAKLFTQVDPATKADYRLVPAIMSQERPAMGISMSVTLAVRYSLIDASNGERIWEKVIRSIGEAGLSDGFSTAGRVRKASEDAVRKNFSFLIRELSALEL